MISLLSPFEWAYLSGVKLHQWLYSAGIWKVRTLAKPVVSVGNLTAGGTGKTPTVIALGEMLLASGYKISVLLRGYKGAYKRGTLLVSDGRRILSSPEMAGDEALVISRSLPEAIVAVGKNRAKVGEMIERTFNVNLHLLDDGFQHLRLSRALNLLLIDTTDPFGGGHLLPLGRLREPLRGASRADAVVLTRTNHGQDYARLLDCLKKVNPQFPCFKVQQTLNFGDEQGTAVSNSPHSFAGTRALAFAGIANPGQFYGSLRALGVNLVYGISFPDHHRYTLRDLEKIRRKCLETDVQLVVTTEKDRENLGHLSLDPLRLVVAKVVFEFDEPMELLELIKKKARPVAE